MYHVKCRGFVDSFKREQFKQSKKVKDGFFEALFEAVFIEKGYENLCELGEVNQKKIIYYFYFCIYIF